MEERDPAREDALGGPLPTPDPSGIGPDAGAKPPTMPDLADETAEDDPPANSQTCPHCGSDVFPSAAPADGLFECPACRQQFFAPDESGEDERAREELEAKLHGREEALSGIRIRQISALRRGLYRTRTYFIVAAAACVMFAAQLSLSALGHVRLSGVRPRPVLYAMAAVATLLLGARCLRRIGELNREAAEPILDEPTTPPDFSTLSDGSQGWRNMELLAGASAAPAIPSIDDDEPEPPEPPATTSEWRS